MKNKKLTSVALILSMLVMLFALPKDVAAATMVWKYVGELAFNMLVLVGMVKMSDHLVKEIVGV